ncbi:hypothetical protein [Paenibacillus naphthalenovorans]|uniref:Large polyvalent protein associated domain-containing protein n=1 Tax=Paenibacillus naphthalenovorans TaxID=162209 RepID=A0A0U2U7C3_9BACL|nr:hypothetical protein [Paenibacillus naphthalenovorans]ALS22265.1 hypothetical protein IJ22_18910 [Paenibacillus naphthalenovorans]
MHYSDKREAKVRICHALEEKGWKIYGYKEDRSDSMTDYYDPASWDGIAEKNGYILVIDQYNTYYSGYQVKKYNYNSKKYVSNERIKKLEALMNDPASTENEKASCAVLIEKEKEKAGIEPEYTILETYPTFKHANPKACSWHIEKDGQIIAKGKGVFSVNEYDWEDKTKTAAEQKAEKVNAFINKIESILTDADALQPEIVKVEKKVIKPVLKEDQTINVNDILSFSYHGHYWIVTDIYTVGEQVRVTYELLGSEKRGYQRLNGASVKRYYQPLERIKKQMEEGKANVYTLQEVTEVIEKTVYKKTKRKQKMSDAPQIETSEKTPEQPQEQAQNNTNTYKTDIADQATSKQLWALHCATKLDTRQLKISKQKASELISKSKNGQSIIDEVKTLLGLIVESENDITADIQMSQEETTEQIKDNVIYHDFGNVEQADEQTKTVIQAKPQIQEEEQIKPMSTFDDILSKFDNVKVTTDSKIATDDLEYCINEEREYKKAIDLMIKFSNEIKEVSGLDILNGEWHREKSTNTYLESYKLRDFKQISSDIKDKFICNIANWFNDKYNVTIDYDKIQRKYDLNVTYQNIIDEIMIQLDGYNFTEKAVQEIKGNAKKTVINSDKITIKNNKLIIDGWFSHFDSIWREHRLSGKSIDIFNALQHFDNGSIKGNEELNSKYIGYNNERNQANYERYEPMTLDKVKSIKFLKNGKLEIEFKSNQLSTQFAKEYCGYNQKSA